MHIPTPVDQWRRTLARGRGVPNFKQSASLTTTNWFRCCFQKTVEDSYSCAFDSELSITLGFIFLYFIVVMRSL